MGGSQSTVPRVTFHLPFDITIEILSRLPVKSLLRFKSVCKTWYALIETPDFFSKQFISVWISLDSMQSLFREIPGAEWQWAQSPGYNEELEVKQIIFGFGFHPSANDYKLIRIVYYASPIRGHSIRAHLYVMSTDTWTKIDPNKLSLFVGR
ncbi:probable F-box protein At1g14315 [Rhododendron vialii]|uniref:probable F-box protein At1g14315 n=1 Tax=Rhododendron vialii TaxID=182163 RepID=UPI00265E915B|nr:probable F-box protein At1g14315 [Rhododendron vialii]